MACPGGCAGGGGQLFGYDPERVRAADQGHLRAGEEPDGALSYKNPAVAAVYKEFLGEPGSHTAHELLHTAYAPRKAAV